MENKRIKLTEGEDDVISELSTDSVNSDADDDKRVVFFKNKIWEIKKFSFFEYANMWHLTRGHEYFFRQDLSEHSSEVTCMIFDDGICRFADNGKLMTSYFQPPITPELQTRLMNDIGSFHVNLLVVLGMNLDIKEIEFDASFLLKCKSMDIIIDVYDSTQMLGWDKKFFSILSLADMVNLKSMIISSKMFGNVKPFCDMVFKHTTLEKLWLHGQLLFKDERANLNRVINEATHIQNVFLDCHAENPSCVTEFFLSSLMKKQVVEINLMTLGVGQELESCRDVENINAITDHLSRSQSVRDLKLTNIRDKTVPYILSIILQNKYLQRVHLSVDDPYVLELLLRELRFHVKQYQHSLRTLTFRLEQGDLHAQVDRYCDYIIKWMPSLTNIVIRTGKNNSTSMSAYSSTKNQRSVLESAITNVVNHSDLVVCMCSSSVFIPRDIIDDFKVFLESIPNPVV